MHRISLLLPLLMAVHTGAQTMTEVGASAAGGAIGSAAGKKVSDGITAIFGKVEKTTAKAARPPEDSSRAAPLLDVGPGTVKVQIGSGAESVPPPPPPAAARRASVAKPAAPAETLPEIVPPPPPPPPQASAEDLKKIATGTRRDELLKLGQPGSRIMMDEDGHLLEVFSYFDKDMSIGRVRLTDGAVSSVEIR